MKLFITSVIAGTVFVCCSVFYSCNSCSSANKTQPLPEEPASDFRTGTNWNSHYESVLRYMTDSMPFAFEHISADIFMENPASCMSRYPFNEYMLVTVLMSSIVSDVYFLIDKDYRIVNVTVTPNTYRANSDVEYRFIADWNNDGKDELIEYRTEYRLDYEFSEKDDARLWVWSFTGNKLEVTDLTASDKNTGNSLLYKRHFQDKTLFVAQYYYADDGNDWVYINYCIFDREGMIDFHREFASSSHHLEDVTVEDWDNDGRDDIRITYSEYKDFHDCIKEAVFRWDGGDSLVPIFLITTEDCLLFKEGYPDSASYSRYEYKRLTSGVFIHEYDGTVNLNEDSPDYGKKTQSFDMIYREDIVNTALKITDIYIIADDE
jgi:hypothetical protein